MDAEPDSPRSTPGAADPHSWRRQGLLAIEILILVNLLLLSVAHHLWATAPPTAPVQADSAGHMQRSAAQYAMITSGLTLREKAFGMAAWPRIYPPLVFDVSAAWCTVLGTGPSQALRAFVVYLLVLGTGAWLIGRAAGGPLVGLATACAALADNAMLNAKLFFYLDMPMTAFLVLTLGLMAASDMSRRRGPTLGVGIALALGFLCKFTMVFFLAVPLLVWMAWSLARCERRWQAAWRFVLIIGLTGAVVGYLASLAAPQSSEVAFETPLEDRLLAWWWAWCVLALVLAQRSLEPRARNCAQGLLLSGAMVGPWLLTNAHAIMQRSGELGLPGSSAAEKLQMSVWPFLDPWTAPLCVLGALVAVLAASRRPVLLPVALALACTMFLNLRVLSCSMLSYYVPVVVLISILAVAWVPRRLAPLALIGMGAVFVARLYLPMQAPSALSGRPWLSRLVNYGRGVHTSPRGTFDVEGARGVLDRLPVGARSLVVATVPGTADEMTNALYIADMAASWRGSEILVARASLDERHALHLTFADGDDVRQLMLDRTRGRVTPDLANTPPDVVLVLAGGGLTVEDVFATWGRAYDRVETDFGPLLVRRAFGAR